MAIEITAELQELRAQAEGQRPFVRSGLFEKLREVVCTPAYWKMTPQQRLTLGYYLAAERRHAELTKPN